MLPYLISYIVFAIAGSSLLKAGSSDKISSLFTVPLINLRVSAIMLIGFACYGVSFILYTILLSKNDLSFITPVITGCVYVLLMITAFVFFHEPITATKIIGSLLVLAGVILMAIK